MAEMLAARRTHHVRCPRPAGGTAAGPDQRLGSTAGGPSERGGARWLLAQRRSTTEAQRAARARQEKRSW